MPPFVESKKDEAYSGDAAIGNGPRACVFISICLYVFWCTAAPVSALLAECTSIAKGNKVFTSTGPMAENWK